MHVCDSCKLPLVGTYKVNMEGYSSFGAYIHGSKVEKELCKKCYDKLRVFIQPSSEEAKITESTNGPVTTTFKEHVTASGSAGMIPNTMVINCESIKIADAAIELEIDVTDAMKNTDKLIINGNEFIRKSDNTRTWHVVGYAGRSDYDGPDDDNLDFTLTLDKSISKDEVYTILSDRYKKYRNTVFKLYLIEN